MDWYCCVANMSYVALVVESLTYGAGGPKSAHILLLLLLLLLLIL